MCEETQQTNVQLNDTWIAKNFLHSDTGNYHKSRIRRYKVAANSGDTEIDNWGSEWVEKEDHEQEKTSSGMEGDLLRVEKDLFPQIHAGIKS